VPQIGRQGGQLGRGVAVNLGAVPAQEGVDREQVPLMGNSS
jgi:hypothetical protein